MVSPTTSDDLGKNPLPSELPGDTHGFLVQISLQESSWKGGLSMTLKPVSSLSSDDSISTPFILVLGSLKIVEAESHSLVGDCKPGHQAETEACGLLSLRWLLAHTPQEPHRGGDKGAKVFRKEWEAIALLTLLGIWDPVRLGPAPTISHAHCSPLWTVVTVSVLIPKEFL